MKKIISLLCVSGCLVQPVWAADFLPNLGGIGQTQFRSISEDLGSALSYKAVTPTAPLGVTGFDLGLEVTSTQLQNSAVWQQATGDSMSSLIVPKLHVFKGLPLNFDIGAFYSSVPTTNIKLYGGELRYAILEGGAAVPAVGIRGALTKLTGVSQIDLNTKSLDVSISKGFAMFTPYAGVGEVWVDSTPNGIPTVTSSESFHQNKIYVGGNLNFGLVNVALEYDKTGSAPSYSAKLGFRF